MLSSGDVEKERRGEEWSGMAEQDDADGDEAEADDKNRCDGREDCAATAVAASVCAEEEAEEAASEEAGNSVCRVLRATVADTTATLLVRRIMMAYGQLNG